MPLVGRPAATAHGRKAGGDGIHHTRIGGVWVAVAVAVVLGVALVDFIVQNTRSVRVEFFGAHGQMPVAVALLGAALAGRILGPGGRHRSDHATAYRHAPWKEAREARGIGGSRPRGLNSSVR